MPTLLLLRHAKSDYPPGVPDRDRPLSARGRRDAVAAGEWLRAAYPGVDEVVVSPAARAQQTWAHVEPRIAALRCRTDDRIYDDWGSELAEVVASLDATTRIALIIGHNPGIEEYAGTLARGGDLLAQERMHRKYPTSGIAVLDVAGPWASPGPATLAAFAVPRG